jgi:hypothetical protein
VILLYEVDGMIKHIVMFKFKKFAESNNKLGNIQMLRSYLEALYSYQKHPEHLKVAGFVGRVCESRTVVDYVF